MLSNVGLYTHTQIGTFIASKGATGGNASLDSNSKSVLSQIPSIATTSVNVVNTITDRNWLLKLAMFVL